MTHWDPMTLCHFIRLKVWQSNPASWDNPPTGGLRRILPCYYWRMFSQQMSVKNLLSPCGRKMVTGLRDFGSIFHSGSIAMEIPWNHPFPNWKCRNRFASGSVAILIECPEGMLFSGHRTFLFEGGGKVNSCGSVLILQCWSMLAEILAWLVCWLQVS